MQTISIPTAIRVAFENIQVKAVKDVNEAKRPAVSLNVTTKCFKQMVKDGIIINQARAA